MMLFGDILLLCIYMYMYAFISNHTYIGRFYKFNENNVNYFPYKIEYIVL